MKCFTSSSEGAKANFVDRNNTLVGYDMSQDCCEHADWLIGEHPAKTMTDGKQDWPEADLEPYLIATDSEPIHDSIGSGDLDEGGSISFRLIADGKPNLWLTLFNCHNGYYSHGFTVEVGGKKALEGSL